MRKSPDIYITNIRRFFRDGTPPNGETPELKHDPQTNILWDIKGPSMVPERIQPASRKPSGLGEYASQAAQVIFDNTPLIGPIIQITTGQVIDAFTTEEKLKKYNDSML